MPVNRLVDFKQSNDRLLRGRVDSRDRAIGMLEIDCNPMIRTYTDALDRVISTIIKIRDA